MPRLKRSDKRRHEVTLALLNVLANMGAYGDPGPWVKFWGGPAEGRAAFEALRSHRTRHGVSYLRAQDGETYDAWLDRIATGDNEPDPRRAPAKDDADEDAEPWRNPRR